jgi:stearoyl-CoA desaturase (delta-9 desaturase)
MASRLKSVSRADRIANLLAVVIPFVAFVAALALLWDRAVGPRDLGVLAVMYLLSGLGVTVGFHRLLTHRAFETHRPLKYLLAVLGSLSVQGPVIHWVADHRKHHAHTDEEGDPHSPHVGGGSGLRGLLHAHVGWLLRTVGQADVRRYAPELLEDPGMRRISRRFELIVLAGLALPFALGYALGGTLEAALTALLWGGLVRVFLLHHVTWSINSVCHFFGRRRFATDDHSTNVFWLALPSLGESWHHNHHAFPRAARHGLRRWELDPSAAVIAVLERLGLAWNVIRITPARQRQREAAQPAA